MPHTGRWRVAVLAGAGLGAIVSMMGCAGGGAELETSPAAAEMRCGPQTPRDVSRPGGTNPIRVPGDGTRPPRLCAVHFHLPAEHAGIAACPAVDEHAAAGVAGDGVCAPPTGSPGRPIRPGDEIEFHVVYTNCPPWSPPRPGLDNCVCDRPQDGPDPMVLMAFAQKYVVTAGGEADPAGVLREPGADAARFGGSTTGPKYGSGRPGDPLPCSPPRVQWVVERDCREMPIAALAEWCRSNPWNEDHAEGARELITREDWLAPYDG